MTTRETFDVFLAECAGNPGTLFGGNSARPAWPMTAALLPIGFTICQLNRLACRLRHVTNGDDLSARGVLCCRAVPNKMPAC
ncbi:hypothetical protein HLB35_14220 [Halomonas sp. TBZ9]|uniref:Uncharacterized protein n=1 Tax=Vreelandella azerica TaxID=2732867 RepID=A0A7Y3XBU5_9GAMM|nr:hypothetical protein [Halomonas azerica]NOG32626.1 hypothetical protein [Halomonas azerica]